MAATNRATRRVLSRFGAFVRQRARSSIRRRKRPGRPGEPPTNRTGLLKKFIYFGYEARNRSVVVGPAKLNQRSPYDNTTVPELLERGGTVNGVRRGKRKRMRYRGNPYMGPALRAEEPRLPAMWKNSIKRK